MSNIIVCQGDLNEASKLQKRQKYEEERKKRIFNARKRMFGLDIDTLERQIAEKVKTRHVEAERDSLFEQQTEHMQKVLRAKELELEKRKRVAESDLNYYRCRFQTKEMRREFDLNDPDYLRKAQPVRISDDDLALGISSAQIFMGEDLGNRERKRRQTEQQRAWLDQQIKEKKEAEKERRSADKTLVESVLSRDQCLEGVAKSENKQRHQVMDSIRHYNCEMARQKRDERIRKKRENTEDDMAEIYNMLSSDMLTENPDVAQSRTDPNKKIAFMYRGMTPEELKNFRRDQHQQVIDRKKMETEQQLIDKQWEQYALNMDRELQFKEWEVERKRQQAFEKVLESNHHLAREQARQNKFMDTELRNNRMSKEFYDNFNTTTR